MSRPVRKSWNSTYAQSIALLEIFEAALAGLSCSTVALPDGNALHVSPASPVDVTTLPHAAGLCHRYLKLGDGDVALTNDPFSGGTTLSDFTLVAGVALEGGNEADVLIASRISFPARFSATGKLDDEGVRIPPMPIAPGGKLNREILGAISGHPLAPRGLVEALEAGLADLQAAARRLKGFARDPGSELKKTAFRRYLADSANAFEHLMHRLPLGTALVSLQLAQKETLKLQLKITETRLFFDFAGTESSKLISLTDDATFGACVATTVAALGGHAPLNAGVFGQIQVSTPSRTLLSGQAPTGTMRGMTIGAAAVGELVLKAIAKLNATFRSTESAAFEGLFQIRFDDGRHFSVGIAPGAPARPDAGGASAHALWSSRRFNCFSIETAERISPIAIVAGGQRAGSGGKGKFNGGDGSFISIRVTAPGTLDWAIGTMALRQEGLESGRSGTAAVIAVEAGGERTEFNSSEGSHPLKPGDLVHVLACGAGAFGEPEAPAEKE